MDHRRSNLLRVQPARLCHGDDFSYAFVRIGTEVLHGIPGRTLDEHKHPYKMMRKPHCATSSRSRPEQVLNQQRQRDDGGKEPFSTFLTAATSRHHVTHGLVDALSDG